ncbi:unnamed protein product, partial [Polarella glacialis]
DLVTLKWRDGEGGNSVQDVPLSAIEAVEEEASPEDEEDAHSALTVRLKGSAKFQPKVLSLVCSSSEDLESWRDGLHFLLTDSTS